MICILMTYRLSIYPSIHPSISSPLFFIIFKTSQPGFPVLQHQFCLQLVSMSRRAVLVGDDNESIFNLQQSSSVWGQQQNGSFSSGLSGRQADLILIVGVAVQGPGIGGHLDRVVKRIAQEWFWLLGRLPVDNAQDTSVDRSSRLNTV